ncbi:MAG: DUF2971 domain-containing protein [Ferruginibacter sp.]
MSLKLLEDVPDVLYKYRDWSNGFHKSLLVNQELYFCSIDQFNDPFDGTIPHRYNPKELTEDNIFLKYRQITMREHPDWNEQKVQEHCFTYQHMGLFHNEKYMEDFEKDTLESMNRKFGMVCLCKRNDNFLLWSHYANSHTGFCIGFDKFKLFEDTKAQFSHMIYETELPTLGLFDNVFEHFTKLIGTKSKTWEYEDEYRLTKPDFVRKSVQLRKETIVEILFGCKMLQSEKFALLKIIEANYPHARVFDISLSKTKFESQISQIR